MENIKFNGSKKQNKWAGDILSTANLTPIQIDNLLRFAGPKMHSARIMDITIIIENRRELSAYADSLAEFYKLTREEKHAIAMEAVGAVTKLINQNI